MSATYSILSSLSPREMLDLERACIRAVEEYLDDHPDCEDEWGEMGAGGLTIPSADQVREAYAHQRVPLDPAVIERLGRCQSVFSIDRPGDIEGVGGLQVSILRFLLERAGESLVLLNDYPFEEGEALLAKLRKRREAKGFGESRPGPKKRRPVARREAKAGELRAIRVLDALERAVKDARVAIDVKRALLTVSELARSYGALLLEEGAISDARAQKALGIRKEELVDAADELDRALARR